MSKNNRQWRLSSRPEGLFKKSDFSWHQEPLPALQDGEILIRVLYLSLDPTQRIWAIKESYLPVIELGTVMRSLGLGVVEESKNTKFQKGDIVQGMTGWQDYVITDGKGFQKLPAIPGLPLDIFLGPLGMPGLTAYYGLLDIGKPKKGETLVVSAAAGAVGSVVCQIGLQKDLKVVGICGSDEKCSWLTDEIGIQACVNYKTENVYKSLRNHCKDGIDIYFENVGGPILDAVLAQINIGARIPLCGYISQYTANKPMPGPQNVVNLISKRALIQGFLVMDYYDRAKEALTEMAQWVQQGTLKYKTDIHKGLENTPTIINKLFDGSKTGKLLIEVSEVPR